MQLHEEHEIVTLLWMIQVENFHKEILYMLKWFEHENYSSKWYKKMYCKSYNGSTQKMSNNKYELLAKDFVSTNVAGHINCTLNSKTGITYGLWADVRN